MNAFSNNGLKAYSRVGVETGVLSASPQQLILMLYEGAITAISSAQYHLRQKEIAAKGEAISKAIAIIDGGLRASLDLSVGGGLAKGLFELYEYMSRRLLQANLRNDHAALDEVRQLLLQLKGAWETLAAKPAAAATTTTTTTTTPGTPPQPRGAATYGRA